MQASRPEELDGEWAAKVGGKQADKGWAADVEIDGKWAGSG